jgi:hypothetical protein
VQRFFGEVEVVEQADQGCEDTPRVGSIQRIDPLARAVMRFFFDGSPVEFYVPSG